MTLRNPGTQEAQKVAPPPASPPEPCRDAVAGRHAPRIRWRVDGQELREEPLADQACPVGVRQRQGGRAIDAGGPSDRDRRLGVQPATSGAEQPQAQGQRRSAAGARSPARAGSRSRTRRVPGAGGGRPRSAAGPGSVRWDAGGPSHGGSSRVHSVGSTRAWPSPETAKEGGDPSRGSARSRGQAPGACRVAMRARFVWRSLPLPCPATRDPGSPASRLPFVLVTLPAASASPCTTMPTCRLASPVLRIPGW